MMDCKKAFWMQRPAIAFGESWIWLLIGAIRVFFFASFVVEPDCQLLCYLPSQHEDVSEQFRYFTDAEQELFNTGFRASIAFSGWKERKMKCKRALGAGAKRKRGVI